MLEQTSHLDDEFELLSDDIELATVIESHPDNPARTIALESIANRWGARELGSEALKEDMKVWFKERGQEFKQKVEGHMKGLEGFKRRHAKLPEDPVLNEASIAAAGWSVPLYFHGKLDVDLITKYAGDTKTIEGAGKREIVSYDFSAATRMSTFTEIEGTGRKELDVSTARALINAKAFSLYIGKNQVFYMLPGAVILTVDMRKDGTNKVKYGAAPRSLDYIDRPLEGFWPTIAKGKTVPALSRSEYKEVKATLAKLISGYSTRLKNGGVLSNAISDLYKKIEDLEEDEKKLRKIYTRQLKSNLAIEEAFTLSIKRCIQALLDYAEKSQI